MAGAACVAAKRPTRPGAWPTSRMVVVGWDLRGVARLMLNRALAGAGAPGRRACPGRGVSPSAKKPVIDVRAGLKGKGSTSSTGWDGGKAEYGVDVTPKSSSSPALSGVPRTAERTLLLDEAEDFGVRPFFKPRDDARAFEKEAKLRH